MPTFEEVKEFLTAKKDEKEVQELLATMVPDKPVTKDKAMAFLETEEGKELIQPQIDREVTKAVKTRDKSWEDRIEPEVKKRLAVELVKLNPQETPEQKQIRELNEKFEASEAARAKDQLKRQVVELAAKENVDPFFVDSFLPATIEEAALYIQQIKKRDAAKEEKLRNEIVSSAHKPGSGEGGNKKTLDLSKLTPEQIIEMELKGTLDEQLGA